MTDNVEIDIIESSVSSSSGSMLRLFGANITPPPPPVIINPVRHNSQAGWTPSEDSVLARAVSRYHADWRKIAEWLPGRTNQQCAFRWRTVLDPTVHKGKWTLEEDNLLKGLVGIYGATNWPLIAKSIPGRIAKQCRERWLNCLNPEISREAWSQMEDRIVCELQKNHRNKWTYIAKFLPGRTNQCVKNHWNNCLRRRVQVPEHSESSSNLRSEGITIFGVHLARHQNNTS